MQISKRNTRTRHKTACESLRLHAEVLWAAVSGTEMVEAEQSTQDLFVQARKLRAQKTSAEVRRGRPVSACSLL